MIVRSTVAALSGAIAGVLVLLLIYSQAGGVALEMDRDLPSFVSGLYQVERTERETFAWTSPRVVIRLAGLDRRTPWTCTMRVRGAREGALPQPDISLAFDAAGGHTSRLSNDYREIVLEVPARPDRAGLTLTADVGPTFVPGGADTRELGAQVDWIRCSAAGLALPPPTATWTSALGTAAFALVPAAAGASLALLVPVVAVAATAIGLLLAIGGGGFGAYPSTLLALAAGAAVATTTIVWSPAFRGRKPLSSAALAAVVLSGLFGCVKLAALSHPAKPLIDAVFQAHRLEWVLSGRYFFTQPLPDGVQFPYAIGLYFAAAPLAGWITDHVLLLRLVVIAAETTGGAMLYVVVARGFRDRWAGLVAVVLFHLVPLPYVVIGNANLTNAFAQAVALIGIASLALIPLPATSPRAVLGVGAVTLLTALAFMSHVSTIVLLAGVLGMAAVTFAVAGGADLRRLALAVIAAGTLAAVLAVGLYYRHFTDVYRQALERVTTPAVSAAGAEPQPIDGTVPAILVRPLTWPERAGDAALQTVTGVGWPVLVLGMAGAIVVVIRLRATRERIPLLLVAWGGAWIVFLLAGTLTRVDTEYQRYAAEFVGRVNLAAYPVAVMLAAVGASSIWSAHGIGRAGAIVLLGAAAVLGGAAWFSWFSG